MKIALVAIAVGLLLTACSKTPSDAEIRQKIPGLWTPDFNTNFTWKIESDGHFFKLFKLDEGEHHLGWTEDGSWGVTNRILVFAMTNRGWPDYTVPTEYYRVIHIDDHEMRFISGDMTETARKKLMPNTALEPTPTAP